ncbi:hypothetical protein KAT36_00050 [Candidatus Pacearchaeota archaeon]|nr:hypothetical protein [Candidatus Pacearchaeota archaeon]
MRGVFVGVFVLILIISLGSSFSGWFVYEEEEVLESDVDVDNLIEVLSENEIVRNLPEGALIRVELYGNISGDYLVSRGNISKYDGSEVDFVLGIDSRYLDELSSVNYCEIGERVLDSGDFWYKLNMGKFGLFWKYKGMIKYRACFGF